MSGLVSAVKIAVGSKNPIKYNASVAGALRALKTVSVDAEGFNVASGVPDQPIGDAETRIGAINRAKAAFSEYFALHNEYPSYSIGLEGGVSVTFDGEMENYAWIAVYNGVKLGTARTASLFLPSVIRDIVLIEGLELGAADDSVFGTHNSKQSAGAVGLLTNGVIDRAAFYEQAVILAFVPFHWNELYK